MPEPEGKPEYSMTYFGICSKGPNVSLLVADLFRNSHLASETHKMLNIPNSVVREIQVAMKVKG